MHKIDLAPVQRFMLAAGQVKGGNNGAVVPSTATAIKTLDFIASELQELRDALVQYQAAPNPSQLVEVAKELADVFYTAGNVGVALALPMGPVFAAVAKSNESKFLLCDCAKGCETCRHTGLVSMDRDSFKVPKGPHYKPANNDITDILRSYRRIP